MQAKINYRFILLNALLAVGSFALGAYWAVAKVPPYIFLRNLKDEVFLHKEPIHPNPLVSSSFATLEFNSFNVGDELSIERPGGGIYAFDNKVLVMSSRGEFFLYQNNNRAKSVKKLDIKIDNAYSSFRDFVTKNKLNIRKHENIRFIDIIYDRQSSRPALLVSHHQWHDDKECYTIRLSELPLKRDQPLENVSAETGDWQEVYDTAPCLPMKTNSRPLAGHMSGGRIVLEDANSVLLTVGDHEFDGLHSTHIHAQDKSSDFGKIIRVNLTSGSASHVSMGHRNPQGLLIDADGTIWSTEHGPRGGDELNIIRQDVNYGWPYVSYGSEYEEWQWPLSKNQNRHDGYARPIFSWGLSMGISNLIQVKGFLPEWDGDLLVSSLNQRTLHRLRYRGGRVIFDEPIYVGSRIRDLDQLEDGTIILWTDDTSVIEMKPVQASVPLKGHGSYMLEGAMQQQPLIPSKSCQECHSVISNVEAEDVPVR